VLHSGLHGLFLTYGLLLGASLLGYKVEGSQSRTMAVSSHSQLAFVIALHVGFKVLTLLKRRDLLIMALGDYDVIFGNDL
jgi:hypothetical protein